MAWIDRHPTAGQPPDDTKAELNRLAPAIFIPFMEFGFKTRHCQPKGAVTDVGRHRWSEVERDPSSCLEPIEERALDLTDVLQILSNSSDASDASDAGGLAAADAPDR